MGRSVHHLPQRQPWPLLAPCRWDTFERQRTSLQGGGVIPRGEGFEALAGSRVAEDIPDLDVNLRKSPLTRRYGVTMPIGQGERCFSSSIPAPWGRGLTAGTRVE